MHIDSHQHFWRYDKRRDAWITDEMSVLKRDFLPDDLIPELRANRIDGSIAVQAGQSEQETLFLLELASRFSEIKGVVGWVDLCSPELPERLEYFSQFEKLCGFRHVVQSEPDDRYMLRQDFLAGIASLQRFQFTYDILIYPQQLPAAIELAAKFPEQRFVVDHLAKPPIRSREVSDWARSMKTIATFRSVGASSRVDLCSTCSSRSYSPRTLLTSTMSGTAAITTSVGAFGPDRLMFGSDWPVCLLAGTYQHAKELVAGFIRHLPITQQEQIFGANATHFYGLKTLL